MEGPHRDAQLSRFYPRRLAGTRRAPDAKVYDFVRLYWKHLLQPPSWHQVVWLVDRLAHFTDLLIDINYAFPRKGAGKDLCCICDLLEGCSCVYFCPGSKKEARRKSIAVLAGNRFRAGEECQEDER